MVFRSLTFLGLVLSITSVPAHNEHPLGRQAIEWGGSEQVLRTLAVNFDFDSGDNYITYRPHGRVEVRDGHECLVGPYFLFDIDDRFAFDIDEDVTLELLFDRSVSSGFNLSYDHAVAPRAVGQSFAAGDERWVRHSVRLDRARFANRKYEKTDLAIGAPNSKFPPGDYKSGHEVAICGLSVVRQGKRKSERDRTPASGKLSLSIRDENGADTTARLGIFDHDGKAPLASADALVVRRFGERVRQLALRFNPRNWPASGSYVFYADGRYETPLEPGSYQLVVSKGPEYRLVRRSISITEGQALKLEISLQRWRDLPAQGWYSGDDHIHIARPDPSENDNVLAYTQAEDVHVANLLQMGNVTTSHFPQYAFGDRGQHYQKDYALVSGQESPRTSHRGHTIGLNAKRFHWPGDDYFLYDRTADAIHADGGMFGYAHVALDAFRVAWGLALDVPLGLIDFVEMLQMDTMNTGYLYDFLNMGFRLLPSAGSDYPYIHVAGTERIYAKLDGPFSVAGWFDAWRSKRSFVSNGPVIEFELNGNGEQNEFALSAGGEVQIKATADLNPDWDRLARLELVRQGNVIASVSTPTEPDDDGPTALLLEHTFSADVSGWLALRAYGENNAKAHTAPVYLYVDGLRHFHDAETAAPLARRYSDLLRALKSSRPTLDEEWERFNVEADVLSKWDDDKPELDQRIERALEIYRVLIDNPARGGERP